MMINRVPALKVTHDEDTNEVSVDVCDDPFQYKTLDVSNLPILITVGQVNLEILLLMKLFRSYFRSMEFIRLTPPSKKIQLRWPGQ
jgi:hypothetical protein